MTFESVTPYEMHKPVGFMELLLGAAAAPLFWLGQLMLGYAVSAQACYPGDHPEAIATSEALPAAILGFDIVAILAAAAGGVVAWRCFVKARRDSGRVADTAGGRASFLALWGIFASLWFFGAILFNTIASLTVPLCVD
jgi:hypothetical protein